jgi:hypothetical protein
VSALPLNVARPPARAGVLLFIAVCVKQNVDGLFPSGQAEIRLDVLLRAGQSFRYWLIFSTTLPLHVLSPRNGKTQR